MRRTVEYNGPKKLVNITFIIIRFIGLLLYDCIRYTIFTNLRNESKVTKTRRKNHTASV